RDGAFRRNDAGDVGPVAEIILRRAGPAGAVRAGDGTAAKGLEALLNDDVVAEVDVVEICAGVDDRGRDTSAGVAEGLCAIAVDERQALGVGCSADAVERDVGDVRAGGELLQAALRDEAGDGGDAFVVIREREV